MEGGLQQPDPGGLSLARAVKHGAHQPSPDRLVLRRRMNRDRPDARDRPTFVEKITTDDLSFLLGHCRVEARIRQHHRQETRRCLCRWKIPGEIVSIVDCLECFEADWAADSGIRRCTRSQHYAHGSPALNWRFILDPSSDATAQLRCHDAAEAVAHAGDEPVSLGHLSVLPLTVRRVVRSARRPVPRSWPRAPWRAPDQGRRA